MQQFSLLTVARPSLCLQARHFNNFHHTSGIPVLSYLYSYIHFVPLRKRRWRFVSFSILGTLLICLHTVLRRFPPSCLHSILSVTPLRPFLLLHASAVVPAIFLEGVCEACVKRNREKRLVFGASLLRFFVNIHLNHTNDSRFLEHNIKIYFGENLYVTIKCAVFPEFLPAFSVTYKSIETSNPFTTSSCVTVCVAVADPTSGISSLSVN